MLSRNSLLFKGFIRQSISKPWSLSSLGKRTVLNENILQLIKNRNIISNQKNITDINLMMKGELRCTSRLSNILSPNSIITDSNDEKIVEKEEETVVEKNQSASDIIESIPTKRNFSGDILPESKIPAQSKLAKQRSPRIASISKKILRYPDFKIVNHPKNNGDPTQTLIIPISKDCPDEEIWCHTFHFKRRENKFICNQLQKDGKVVFAKFFVEDGEDTIELSNYEFIGKPVFYKDVMEKLNRLQNLEFEIIEKPYFEIQKNGSRKNKPLLTVFTNNDQTRGYELYYDASNDMFCCNTCYTKHKIYVSAKLNIRKDGTEEIRMGKHVCEAIDVTKIIVREPNYIKLENNQLFILLSKESNMGYKYNRKDDNFFVCRTKGCSASAKCFQDENQKEYFELSKIEHICKPIQYQCDISEIEQPDLVWPNLNEYAEKCDNVITKLRENHCKYPLFVWTYVITSAPPESTPERKASCILYVGYTEDCGTRMSKHITDDGVVSELLTKFDTLFMIPILNDIPAACHDLEALIYQLWKCGSLKIQLRNTRSCEWNSNAKEGSLQYIAKNPDDSRHADLVLGVKKFLISQISKIHSDDIIVLESKKQASL